MAGKCSGGEKRGVDGRGAERREGEGKGGESMRRRRSCKLGEGSRVGGSDGG